ncbi:peptide deformylase [Micromonospora sp. NPDC051300]|uniref:peptide deformylase n=1 Tax=Micromonospora sp. NPDC051300 TaxID=3364286 RepID=UPI003793F170
MINPVLYIPEQRDLATDSEGCLSVPGQYADVTRPATATVIGVDLHGQPVRRFLGCAT